MENVKQTMAGAGTLLEGMQNIVEQNTKHMRKIFIDGIENYVHEYGCKLIDVRSNKPIHYKAMDCRAVMTYMLYKYEVKVDTIASFMRVSKRTSYEDISNVQIEFDRNNNSRFVPMFDTLMAVFEKIEEQNSIINIMATTQEYDSY